MDGLYVILVISSSYLMPKTFPIVFSRTWIMSLSYIDQLM